MQNELPESLRKSIIEKMSILVQSSSVFHKDYFGKKNSSSIGCQYSIELFGNILLFWVMGILNPKKGQKSTSGLDFFGQPSMKRFSIFLGDAVVS